MDADAIFWDKNFDRDEVRKILKDETNPRFIETAALLLSRVNRPNEVFSEYLNKISFCNNWRRIKRQMRKNKWNDARIVFWDEIYKVVLQDSDKNLLKISKKRDINIDLDIKKIGDEIRENRKMRGWTQADLAKRSKISQQTISFVEKGYTNISVRTLKKIADALGLKIVIENPEKKTSTTQTYSS